MSPILFFYIFRSVVLATLAASAVIVTSVWVIHSLRFVDIVLSAHVSATIFFELALLALPDLLILVLPLSFFIAILFVYHRLILERECVVLQGAGVSFLALASPAIACAGVLMLVMYSLTLALSPMALGSLKDLERGLRNTLPAEMVHEGVFNTFKNVTVYVQKKHHDELQGVFAHIFDPATRQSYSVMAKEGKLVQHPEGLQILMTMGNRQEINNGKFSILYFDQSLISLAQIEGTPQVRLPAPYELSLAELFFPDSQNSQDQKRLLRAEGHQRLISPLMVPSFALLALAFLLTYRFSRRSLTRPVLGAVGAVIALQTLVLGCTNLSARFEYAIYLNYVMVGLAIVGCILCLRTGPRLGKTSSQQHPEPR